MKPLLIVQTGEAPEPIRARLGGFADWFRAAMRLMPAQVRAVRVDRNARLPKPHEIAGAVITGSAAMVTDRARWSEDTAAWLRNALDAQLPLFGVCYGHQLLAHACGGEVGWLPGGREIGTQMITRIGKTSRDGALLDGLPARFPAHTTHRQSVLAAPRNAQPLARSTLDPHQILRYAPLALSTQFHPELTVRAMRAYIAQRRVALRGEGLDAAALQHAVAATAQARALLRRFARLALRAGGD